MTLQELHDKLLAWATAEARQEELLRARRAYFDRWGEPHEEERSFETRMNGMLDYYLYDHRPEGSPHTTLDLFMRDQGSAYTSDQLTLFRDLGRTVHGLFEVRKLRAGEWVRLRDLWTGEDHEVTERRQMAGLEKGDLLEARLLPHSGKLYFSGAFVYHPREVRKTILAELKKRRKASDGAPAEAEAFLGQLSRMAQKLERYRNVKVESLYDFTAPAPTPPPLPRS
ncbi:MAG: hypothetical protein HZB56_00835 [Deltaproteobacteria bacterium]|nr:hypothetical protein [Deltaproteobacteria bacterium]